MDKQMIGMCGAYCGDCEWKEPTNCPGCKTSKSKMFWGVCGVAKCCIDRGLKHCGLCADVPCDLLKSFFNNPEHGDCGERLTNLKTWAKGGDTYTKLRNIKEKTKDERNVEG